MHSEKSHAQSLAVACYAARLLGEAVRSVRDLLPMCDDDRPVFGVILGSGRGLAADRLLAAGGKSLAYPAFEECRYHSSSGILDDWCWDVIGVLGSKGLKMVSGSPVGLPMPRAALD